MRYGSFYILGVLTVIVLVTGMVYVFAQDRPPEGGPPLPGGGFGPGQGRGPGMGPGMGRGDGARPMRPQMMPNFGAAAAMELSGNMLYLVSGTVVYRINTSQMKVAARCDLAEAGQSKESAAEMFIRKFDTDRDGRISEDEFTGPPQRFEKMDSNADGFVTKDEIPPELLARARRMMRKPVMGGPAAIKVGITSVFVCLGGTLYKLKLSDLALLSSVELEKQESMPGRGRRSGRKRKDEKGKRPRRKKNRDDDDDFGF